MRTHREGRARRRLPPYALVALLLTAVWLPITGEYIGGRAYASGTKIALSAAMVTAITPYGDPTLLVDEQSEAGDPRYGTGGAPTTYWDPGFQSGHTPAEAYIDLGQDYVIDAIYLRDVSNSGEFAVSTGEPGDWTPAFTLTTNTYNQWRAEALDDVQTRYIHFNKTSNTANVSEVVVYGTPVSADTTPPAAISDLVLTVLTPNSIRLTWTAPGDDGNTGTATEYDVRYYRIAIGSEDKWSAAHEATGEPVPAAAGTTQTMVLDGLDSNTKYYICLRAVDEAGNLSGIHTKSKTTPPDTTSPGTVSDLSVIATTATTATLNWTAPGDDGGIGTNKWYDIRFGTSAVTSGNWSAATQTAGETLPAVAGTAQTMIVYGLEPGETYYFALKAIDEAGNLGGLSNNASDTTTDPDAYTVVGASSLDVHGRFGEEGTIYYAVFTSSQGGLTANQVKSAALGAPGGALAANGSIAVDGTDVGTDLSDTVDGLESDTTYYTYIVEDSAVSGLGDVTASVDTTFVRHRLASFGSEVGEYASALEYAAYAPESYYRNPQQPLPFLVFFHGNGESGPIDREAFTGPPEEIEEGDELPFIILSPQKPDSGSWTKYAGFMEQFIDKALHQYTIDPSRFYVTGLSVGGGAAFYYAQSHPDQVAAVVTVAAKQFPGMFSGSSVCSFKDVPVWSFTNDDDPQVPREDNTEVILGWYNACSPMTAPQYTIYYGDANYPNHKHGGWEQTYRTPLYDPGIDIYSWLLSNNK